MLVMLRRAGNGWIAATYDRSGRCLDLFGGPWREALGEALRVTGGSAPPASPSVRAVALRLVPDGDRTLATVGAGSD